MPTGRPGAVRPALPRDAQEVFDLARDLATTSVPTWQRFRTGFAELSTRDDARVLVAEGSEGAESRIDGYLLGFVHQTFYADGPVGWIEELAVRAASRGQGTGRALVDSFEVWAREHEARLVALATRRAEAFYAAIGFEESAVYFRKML